MNLPILLTGLLVAFAAGQVVVIRQQRALAELQVVHELREQWQSVHKEWTGFLVLGGHFYLDIPEDVADAYPVLRHEDVDEYRRLVHFNRRCRSCDEIKSRVTQDEFALLSQRSLEFPEEFHRLPLGLLATVCAYILRGRVSTGTAYEAFGSDLTRNGSSIRYVTDLAPNSTYYLGYYPGVRRRVLILVDLMWTEAAKRGDLQLLEHAKAADTKRKHRTGLRNRRRLREELRRLRGGMPSFGRFEWHLTAAEVAPGLSRSSAFFRRLRAFLGGLRRGPADSYPDRSQWG